MEKMYLFLKVNFIKIGESGQETMIINGIQEFLDMKVIK